MHYISGCKHVEGRAILNLLREVGGTAKTENNLDPALPGKFLSKFWKRVS